MSIKEIVLTIDVDWAPEEMVEDTLQLLDKYGVTATFFCTHRSDALINEKEHELGIHPNFIPLIEGKSEKSKEQIVDELLEIYPNSKGVRAHGLVQSSGIVNLYLERGLQYDTNILMPYAPLSKYVFDSFYGFKRNVYNWSDDIHLQYNRENNKFKWDKFGSSAIINLTFHPFHIYTNTESVESYGSRKSEYLNMDFQRANKNTVQYGVRDMFIEVLSKVKMLGLKTDLRLGQAIL